MIDDDPKTHAGDAAALMAAAFEREFFRPSLSAFTSTVFDALSRSPEVFVLHRLAPDGEMHSETIESSAVYIGFDLAADDGRTVYALDPRVNMYADPAPDEIAQAAPRKPSHRSSQLDRLAQSRAAKAAMLARVLK